MGVTAAVLAIDAGNSKTDVAFVGPDGAVLGSAREKVGFQPPKVGLTAAVDALAGPVAAAREAARIAGRAVDEVIEVSACLANADLPVEEAELTAALHERGWGRTTVVRNDTFALLRAGVDEPRGVAVVCGAGINCVGMLPDGRTARFPAIGKISGDWGGGLGLAEEALWSAARAEDGRGEPSALARTLPGHFGLATMAELIEALHRRTLPYPRVHELTPVLFATSAGGDPVAGAIVRRLADEVVSMATVTLERLDLLAEEVPVVLGGSVLAARHPELDARITASLAAKAPKAVPAWLTAPPVLGAVLLGLDRVGAPPEARARAREHYGL
ncbi:N-acetylglucosamine kinase [Streptomyces sp. NPDC058953]|uniref:N-acetylglucosamine kinase n=1 Tax=unclassified Streptomyces TaxID=2593676 RepID=UPI00367929C3